MIVRLEWRPFVLSFCDSADSAVHWLHYGRGGTGYALAFDPRLIEQAPFDLYGVIYDPARQSAAIQSLVRVMFATTQELRAAAASPELSEIAAHMTATYLRALAVRFKHPSFRAEGEWRLITHDLLIDGQPVEDGIPLDTLYRTVAGRIVPYKEYSPTGFDPSRLVMGASAAMTAHDRGLAQLLEAAGCATLRVSRSAVAVRP